MFVFWIFKFLQFCEPLFLEVFMGFLFIFFPELTLGPLFKISHSNELLFRIMGILFGFMLISFGGVHLAFFKTITNKAASQVIIKKFKFYLNNCYIL